MQLFPPWPSGLGSKIISTLRMQYFSIISLLKIIFEIFGCPYSNTQVKSIAVLYFCICISVFLLAFFICIFVFVFVFTFLFLYFHCFFFSPLIIHTVNQVGSVAVLGQKLLGSDLN